MLQSSPRRHIGLRRLRESKGLTKTQAAYHLGVSERAFEAYERGDRAISVSRLRDIAKLFGLTLDDAYIEIYEADHVSAQE